MVLLLMVSALFNFPSKLYGIKILLVNMVDNPIDETTIIEIAAENPPRKTKTVKVLLFRNCGIKSEYISALTSWPSNKIFPPQAIG